MLYLLCILLLALALWMRARTRNAEAAAFIWRIEARKAAHEGNAVRFLLDLLYQADTKGTPSPAVVLRTLEAWNAAAFLPTPLCGYGEHGGTALSWERGPFYLELEVRPGAYELFSSDRTGGEAVTTHEEWAPDRLPEVTEALRTFADRF